MSLNPISVSFDELISDSQHHPLLRLMCVRLKEEPYMTLGTYFKGLSDRDLDMLVGLVEVATINLDPWSYQQITVMAELLSRAEACEAETIEGIKMNARMFCLIATAANLERKGMVNVIWEHASFGPEFFDKQIVKLKSQ
jgi:hypothetical protein